MKRKEQRFQSYLYEKFSKFIEKYRFSKTNEPKDGQEYSIEYHSNTFVIKLQKYRREFEAAVYKSSNPDEHRVR